MYNYITTVQCLHTCGPHSYESLLVEERQTSQEVMAFHRRMEAWAGSSGSAAERTAAAASVSGGREKGGGGATAMPPAVLAFEV